MQYHVFYVTMKLVRAFLHAMIAIVQFITVTCDLSQPYLLLHIKTMQIFGYFIMGLYFVCQVIPQHIHIWVGNIISIALHRYIHKICVQWRQKSYTCRL